MAAQGHEDVLQVHGGDIHVGLPSALQLHHVPPDGHRLVPAHLVGGQHLQPAAHPVHHVVPAGDIAELAYQLLLEDFAQTNRTFIVSTHIIEEAASVFERVIILDEGRIIENTDTEELIGQFRYVSGRDDVVDQVCNGLEMLSTHQMGRHKTVGVRGEPVKLEEAQGADVDISPMNLQNVFVSLCGHGDAQ